MKYTLLAAFFGLPFLLRIMMSAFLPVNYLSILITLANHDLPSTIKKQNPSLYPLTNLIKKSKTISVTTSQVQKSRFSFVSAQRDKNEMKSEMDQKTEGLGSSERAREGFFFE